MPDLKAARTEAIEGAREMVADRVRRGEAVDLGDRFEIADEAGQVVETIPFSEAVNIIGSKAS